MSNYYLTNNGTKYDRAILDKATELTEGRRDGRISKDDAVDLAKTVNDADILTDVERATVRKVYRDFKFTDAGRDKFEQLNRSAGQQRRHAASETKPGAGFSSQLAARSGK